MKIRKLFSFLMAGMLVFVFSVSAQATLINMGDGTIYDDDLQLSWLQNANTNGSMDWFNANTWADNLVFAGFDNWRLPAADPVCGLNHGCTGSEMGHLYITELGNSAFGPLTNTGDFTNLQAWLYWSGTEYPPNTSYALDFYFVNGNQDGSYKYDDFLYAMAVRPGERSTSVPEPATLLLLGSGLAGMAALRKRFTA
jgi:hypothetical protein